MKTSPIGDVIGHSIGGGWGSEVPAAGCEAVVVIRGADFPNVALQTLDGVPRRFERVSKLGVRRLEPGDIILETSGGTKERPTGRTVFVTKKLHRRTELPMIPASFCRLVRIDSARANPKYIYYVLQNLFNEGGTWEFQNQSTGLSNFQYTVFREKFCYPELDSSAQTAVARLLGSLDDKIAVNAELTSTASRLLAARYDALVAERSESRPLSSLARFINGKAFTKDASGTGRVVIRIAELNSGLGGSTVYNDIEVSEGHLARPGDLLFAWSGSLMVHRWYRPEAIINQHIFKVVPTGGPVWLVHGALSRKLDEFKAIAADKATTMGHIQRHHLDEQVLVPTASRIVAAHDAMASLWERALLGERENLKLAEVRDALLPQLLSGRIRVKDAERVVGEVV